MHYHSEIIMPPTSDIESAVKTALDPFSQHEESEERHPMAFWDWYKIGGRWHGQKIISKLPEADVESFYAELREKNITVAGLRAGKDEINPPDQIPTVEAIWQKHFKDTPFETCPFFKHGADQYEDSTTFPGNVMPISECLDVNGIHRVIITDTEGTISFMCNDQMWNGVNHEQTTWDGTIGHAVEMHKENIARYKPESRYVAMNKVSDDWIAVTVDYHS